AVLGGVPATASAVTMDCSIHPGAGSSAAALKAMTKLTQDAAQEIALSSYGATRLKVTEAELEAENGCLVYSFDVRVAGRSGIDEVLVDAGNGKVLQRNHESPKQEADEATADKARTPHS
ncbi:MAG: PepSY domain-containing protein, partial [Dokdonella sp.]